MGRLLADGRIRVYAASDNGSEPAAEFLEDLPVKDRLRLVYLFKKLASLPPGRFLNQEDFRQVRGPIYELKHYQRRMMCFHSLEGWIVTHGFTKKTDPTPPREIDRAERIMKAHKDARDARNSRLKGSTPSMGPKRKR
jgi:phage-related protein